MTITHEELFKTLRFQLSHALDMHTSTNMTDSDFARALYVEVRRLDSDLNEARRKISEIEGVLARHHVGYGEP